VRPEGGAKADALLTEFPPNDHRLASLIARWPGLPEGSRQAIMAIAREDIRQ